MSRNHFLKRSPEARTEVLEENIVELKSSQYGLTESILKLPPNPQDLNSFAGKGK